MKRDVWLTDKEICWLMKISPSTLTRIMKGQFGGMSEQPLLRVKHTLCGQGRRWDVKSLADVLGKTVEELGY